MLVKATVFISCEERDERLILLLAGVDKSTQRRDIEMAIEMASKEV